MKNFIQKGVTVPLIAAVAVSGGAFVIQGVLCGIAQHDAAVGESVEVLLEGVVEVQKTSAEAWTAGAPVYLDPANLVATVVATAGNILIGAAIEAAADPSSTGIMRLNGSVPAAAVSA